MSALPETCLACAIWSKGSVNQNLFPYLRSEPCAFRHGKERHTAQSTDFKEASHEEMYLFSLNNGHKSLAFDNMGMAALQVLQCSVLFQSFHFYF